MGPPATEPERYFESSINTKTRTSASQDAQISEAFRSRSLRKCAGQVGHRRRCNRRRVGRLIYTYSQRVIEWMVNPLRDKLSENSYIQELLSHSRESRPFLTACRAISERVKLPISKRQQLRHTQGMFCLDHVCMRFGRSARQSYIFFLK